MSLKPKVVILVDASSSMTSRANAIHKALGAIYASISDKADFYYATFRSRYDGLTHVKNLGDICYHAAGSTALFDSVLGNISEVNSLFKPHEKVLFICLTDGEDCASKCKAEDLVPHIENVEKTKKWDYIFVGTNTNADAVGKSMGCKPNKTLSFANVSQGWENVLAELGEITNKWVVGNLGSNDQFFSAAGRDLQKKLGAITFN